MHIPAEFHDICTFIIRKTHLKIGDSSHQKLSNQNLQTNIPRFYVTIPFYISTRIYMTILNYPNVLLSFI